MTTSDPVERTCRLGGADVHYWSYRDALAAGGPATDVRRHDTEVTAPRPAEPAAPSGAVTAPGAAGGVTAAGAATEPGRPGGDAAPAAPDVGSRTDVDLPPGADGAPVVMVHGLRGTHHGLELIADGLPDRNVVIPDLPGYGASGPLTTGRHDVAGYARVIAELIEHLGGRERPVVLLGHSFGSIVAARVAAEHPELVHRLVLVNPIATPALRGPRVLLSKLTAGYYAVGKALPDRLGTALLSHRLIVLGASRAMTRTKDARLRAFIDSSHLQHFSSFHSPEVLSETFHASVSYTVADHAAALRMPVLLIAGATDDIAPVDGQRVLTARIPRGKLVVLPDVGHLVHYETPEAAAGAITEFLGEA
ncbi:alpha/beta hydrolase [Saccharopolyspora cebuensis]|uniref:Alpha/beta fold hydrolase n=1 Tax=Saccharopolyspora cebuensis TaxID=418759 RepID=A0ABV4CH20_9PSEU